WARWGGLWVPARACWFFAAGLPALGGGVQTASLANLVGADHGLPVTTPFESMLVLSWIFAAIGLYLMVRAPKPVAVGTFVLPVVVALVTVAGITAPRTAGWGNWRGATAFSGMGHRRFLLAGAVST